MIAKDAPREASQNEGRISLVLTLYHLLILLLPLYSCLFSSILCFLFQKLITSKTLIYFSFWIIRFSSCRFLSVGLSVTILVCALFHYTYFLFSYGTCTFSLALFRSHTNTLRSHLQLHAPSSTLIWWPPVQIDIWSNSLLPVAVSQLMDQRSIEYTLCFMFETNFCISYSCKDIFLITIALRFD